MTDRFNLVDEPWIPVADHGRVSLAQLFTNTRYRALGGNSVQRVSLVKLLLAIAQSASTPTDTKHWLKLGPDGLATACINYLEQWHDRFYLYGDKPFLQVPAIKAAEIKPFGAVLPEVATGNATVLTESQLVTTQSDADLALLMVSIMSFALGGKKTDNKITLTEGYQAKQKPNGRPNSGKPGPALEFMGLLHTYLVGQSIHETLWINLFTQDQIDSLSVFDGGLGVAPWEQMPDGEDCPVAKSLRGSFIGRLVPMNRFALIAEDGLHYSEGVMHQGYKDGLSDNTAAVDQGAKKPKALWVDPDKRPWRSLTALLSFLDQEISTGFECRQLGMCLHRVRDVCEQFSVWSGGIRVSSNAGEQYLSGGDDYVESMITLRSDLLGAAWFRLLSNEMSDLDTLSKQLYGRVVAYYKAQQKSDGGDIAAKATQMFWQLVERDFQALVDGCEDTSVRDVLRKRFTAYLYQAYNRFCPQTTARQIAIWAQCRPNVGKYLSQG